MAQGQAKRAKIKALKESTRAMRLEFEAAEQKLEDLEEDIQRLDQEEKILCSEVHEAEEPQGEESDAEEEPKHPKGDMGTPHPKGEPENTRQQAGPGDFQVLVQQLHSLVQGMGQPRKKARSEPNQEEDPDATMEFPGGWQEAP